jgi:hypothetical protein
MKAEPDSRVRSESANEVGQDSEFSSLGAMIPAMSRTLPEDAEVYHARERFWRQLAAKVAHAVGSAADWASWIPRSYADGTLMELDGNSIWDERSNQLGRAYLKPYGMCAMVSCWAEASGWNV